ncbi:MAG: hypothetical protein GXY33_04835 [Phycisphaerae bacterium]|nr:hypothetical protein [Phycisphaerae bacterium]
MTAENDSRVVIAVWADPDRSPMGLPAKLDRPLRGEPVLRRTIRRLERVEGAAGIVVFCQPEHEEIIGRLVAGTRAEILKARFDPPRYWPGVQASRKWAKTCWRGGLLGACGFDEEVLPAVLHEVAKASRAEAVLSVPASAVVVDPHLLSRQIAHYRQYRDEYKLFFTQAPPGLSGVVVAADLLSQMGQTSQLLGSALVYRPDAPKPDIIAKPCNIVIDPAVIQTPVRLIGDNKRSLGLIEAMLDELTDEELGADRICRWVRDKGLPHLSRWPDEIEAELVAGWPTPKSIRPAPGPRGPIDAGRLIDQIAKLTAECDDLLVCLGGFGEPTRHPRFAEIVQDLHNAGVWGICLNTTGLLDEPTADMLVDLPIDIVSVLLDVPDRQRYAQAFGQDCYEDALAGIERLIRSRHERRQPLPLVVPEMLKTHETLDLMEPFYDTWLNKVGAAVIAGYCDYAGQLADLAVSSMAGPQRRPCRRLWSRMTVLADGTVPLCDVDFLAANPAGNLGDKPLTDLWHNGPLGQLRSDHRSGRYDSNSLCAKCTQWHRP